MGKKHRMDIPRNLQVTRSSVKVEPSSAESDELQKETLAREGKEVAINRDLAANVQFIPGIQALINSSYHIRSLCNYSYDRYRCMLYAYVDS